MKKVAARIINLADKLDLLGLKKDSNVLDKMLSKMATNEDFEDLMQLFDEKISLDNTENDDSGNKVIERQIPDEQETVVPIEDQERDYLYTNRQPSRLDQLKRRNELLKLKKLLSDEDKKEEETVEEEAEEEHEPELETSFEDEEDDEENNTDDELLDKKLKNDPAALEKVISFVKGHPEILESLLLLLI